MMMPSKTHAAELGRDSRRGFSLIELIVAMGIFMLVSSVSFELFNRHQEVASEQQLTVGLNIGLRNALAQIQLDVANAGNGLIVGGMNIPAWPVGVTISNSIPTSSQCNPSATYPPTYAAACFDTLNIIVVDQNTPALHPCVGTACTQSTSGQSSLVGQFPSSYAAATYAANFHAGDQVLFVQSCAAGGGKAASQSSGCSFTTALLTAAGSVNTGSSGCSAGCVNLSYTSTEAGGGNTASNDPLGMTTNAPAGELTDSYGPSDWVVRLLPITYSVNASNVDSLNNSDPQLMRAQNGTSNVVMDQIISFKVGAALWDNENTSTFQYNYNAADYATGTSPNLIAAPYQYNLIRSVRVSIIGRTEPNAQLISRLGTNSSTPYQNQFDNGPYLIRGNSIIVDPRNLTMNGD